MIRWLLNCCLIVALLWCPVRCQAVPTGLRAGEATSARKCRCCRHVCPPKAVSESERSDVPAESDDCGCGSCLCEGAVAGGLKRLEAPTATLNSVCLEPTVAAILNTLAAAVQPTDPPQRIYSSGHDIAVLHGNLRR